jgi:peptide deformylase
MAILPIVKYGDPILRKKAKPVDPKDPALKKLAQDMKETMAKARGVGLAANQVGVLKQIAVVDLSGGEDNDSLLVLLNPVIVETRGEEECDEGCLSFPEIRGTIVRAAFCRVKAMSLDGEPLNIEGQGTQARILQHETDHLNGVLFVDRMRLASKTLVSGKLKELRQETKAGPKRSR